MMQSDHRYCGARSVDNRSQTVKLMNGDMRYEGLGAGGLGDQSQIGVSLPPQALIPASTPLSPSSHFTTSSLQSSQPLISAVCFSYWDNILGPRIQHVWRSSNHMALHNTTLLHVCSRILNGEICRNLTESHVDSKFYTMPDNGILVAGFIFSAKNIYGLGVHSLALVIPQSETAHYLDKHQLIYNWIIRLVGKLKVLLNKQDTMENALNSFSLSLVDLMSMLSSLHIYGLPRKIELKETTFSPSHTIEIEFIERAISCHLTTMGRSVVVGKTKDRVNLIVATLALFNSPTERVCSRFVQRESPYHQDLWIQAILVSSGETVNIPAKEILSSQYPTTIINISNRRIVQSPAYENHSAQHYETLKDELVCLHYGQEDDMIFPESMFHVVEYPETYVHRLIKEINLLHPACGVRDAYIAQFLRFLQRKALALIKYVEIETAEGSNMSRVNVKRLKQTLGFSTEGDYRVVLATAEKLKPGIYCYIHGHRRHDIEPVVTD